MCNLRSDRAGRLITNVGNLAPPPALPTPPSARSPARRTHCPSAHAEMARMYSCTARASPPRPPHPPPSSSLLSACPLPHVLPGASPAAQSAPPTWDARPAPCGRVARRHMRMLTSSSAVSAHDVHLETRRTGGSSAQRARTSRHARARTRVPTPARSQMHGLATHLSGSLAHETLASRPRAGAA